ncbi:MAG: hypothetical protein HC893_08075 [Chloroflexaceae bacterium]|nr:hypothetical protein [Chloroflexaceae bacterium]
MEDANENPLREFSVSLQANHFIDHCLQAGIGVDGGHLFTELLLKHHNILAGNVTTLMPATVKPDDLLQFRAAHMGDIGDITGTSIVQRVQQYLVSEAGALCVFLSSQEVVLLFYSDRNVLQL